ncbi:hypothetical protein B0T10DRAFT_549721 [Thelonectria olida]|uniref:Apple domain-containing protein n=1 Tax=Thelonectria olida TaxID=1576542 RepID=A0A9P8W1L1_9HYPO|nr:hypothetical protein B0T10DRAFT_549721 [Thelonectria olida]
MTTSRILLLALAGFSFLGVNAGPCRASSSSSSTTPNTPSQTPSSSNTPLQTPSSFQSTTPTTTSSDVSTTSSATSSAPTCQLTIAIEPTNNQDTRRQSAICGRKGLIGNFSHFLKAVTGVTVEQCASECSMTFGCGSIVHESSGWCSLNSGPAFNLQINTNEPAASIFDLSCFSCGDSTSSSTMSSPESTPTGTSDILSTTPLASSTTPATTPSTPTATPGSSYTPFCTLDPTSIEAGPAVIRNPGFEDSTSVNGVTDHSYPWVVANADVRHGTPSLRARNSDWLLYMENPSRSSPASVMQHVDLLGRTPYDFTFWYSIPEIPFETGNEGCRFAIGDDESFEHLQSGGVNFYEAGLIADQYYQASIRFESPSGGTNMPLSLTISCHGTWDDEPIEVKMLVDDIVVPKAPRDCGTRTQREFLRRIPIATKLNVGLDRCIDLCWQTTDCMTITHSDETCRLWRGTSYEEHFQPVENGQSVIYEMVCFSCPAVPDTTPVPSTTTTTTSAAVEAS